MVNILKLLAYFAFFILSLIYFSPKESIYYFAEREIEKYKIIISDEIIADSGFALKLNNASITYDSIQSANVEDINIKIFLLYNSISAKNIKLSNMAASFFPSHIQSVDVAHTILNPFIIELTANGEFGTAKGEMNLLDKTMNIIITPSKIMQTKYNGTLGNLKKNVNGGYSYDKSF